MSPRSWDQCNKNWLRGCGAKPWLLQCRCSQQDATEHETVLQHECAIDQNRGGEVESNGPRMDKEVGSIRLLGLAQRRLS